MAGLIIRELLAGAIDYAGLFPPAGLPLDEAIRNYLEYRDGEWAWMLGRFVVGERDLPRVPHLLDGALSVLSEQGNSRASVIESKTVTGAPGPAYCEVALAELKSVAAAGKYAKLRTGGVDPATMPSTAVTAAFITECARLRLPFKATAGLHHPLRTATMHGFVNLLAGSALLWHGASQSVLQEVLDETEAAAFQFGDDVLSWRDLTLSAADMKSARLEFIHSFGSCSFTEPVEDLQRLGWL